MTKSQEKAIAKLRKMAEKDLFFGDADRYEFKEFSISENEYFVSLVIETGLKNDEGTMAAIFCRDRAQLFIGKRGGVTYPCKGRKGWVTREFKWYSILQAVCDQR